MTSSTLTSHVDQLAEHGARLSTRLRRWWTACREDRTKPVGRQIAEITWLRTRRGFSVGEYYAYGFASERCDLSEIEDYASNRWHWRCHLPALNDRNWTYSVENKFAFAQHCVVRGLRTARVFGVFHPEHGRTVQDEPLRSARQLERLVADLSTDTFVLKPVSGSRGGGILTLQKRRDGVVLLHDPGNSRGQTAEIELDLQLLVSEWGREGVLVQEFVQPHPTLRSLSPSASGTVRIVTLRSPDGTVCEVGATLRLGRAGSVVDNFGRGGVSIGVDLAAGRMGGGFVRSPLQYERVDAHPDTGADFRGRELPHWQETLDLCRRAARSTPGLESIGWDVVLAPDGPVLLEGNHQWDLVGMQLTGGGYLGPEVRDVLNDWGVPSPARLVRTRHSD